MQSRPQLSQMTSEKPYEPEYSSTDLALMKIPEPMMHASSRLMASSRPMVGWRVVVRDESEGTFAAGSLLDGAI